MDYNEQYNSITNHILYDDRFLLLKNDTHHGTNKYDHCKRVSYLSFLLAKLFLGNIRKATRAGLLHDFFYGSRKEKDENDYLNHPMTSADNALNYFNVDIEEQLIIKSHMYHHACIKRFTPFVNKKVKEYLRNNKPNSKEAKIVCIADLLVSFYEVIIYKVRFNISLYILFLINFFNI